MSSSENPFGLDFSAPDISVTDALIEDIDFCVKLIQNNQSNQSLRRIYCRSVSAAVEGSLNYAKSSTRRFNESHLRPFSTILQNLDVSHDIILFKDIVPVEEINLLLDVGTSVNQQGQVRKGTNFINFEPNFKFTFNMIDRVYGMTCSPDYKTELGWAALRKSVDVRNRITHPKANVSHDISDDELKTIVAAHDWFFPFFDEVLMHMGAAMSHLTSEISRCEDPKIKEALNQMQRFIIKHEKPNEGESL
jgi:hypothetical protein